MFPKDFYQYLDHHTLTGIKGGKERETFTNIWIVHVDDRVFARSWNRSDKSWFTGFLKEGVGEIEYDDIIIKVRGKKIDPHDEINERINETYLQKYTQPENIKYAEGFSDPLYANYTMEFLCENCESNLTTFKKYE